MNTICGTKIGGYIQARADSVVKKYGIDANCLTPYGVGPLAPVTSNKTEEGRAKNRRVELVER